MKMMWWMFCENLLLAVASWGRQVYGAQALVQVRWSTHGNTTPWNEKSLYLLAGSLDCYSMSGGLQDARMFSSEGFKAPRGTTRTSESSRHRGGVHWVICTAGCLPWLVVHHHEIFLQDTAPPKSEQEGWGVRKYVFLPQNMIDFSHRCWRRKPTGVMTHKPSNHQK